MKRKIAAIYARVSTVDKQDFQRQINDLTELIKSQGYKETQIQVFSESISGYTKKDNRPKLKELINLVENNPKDYIIYTTEISRIGRNPTETRRIIDQLTDLGVPVYIKSLNQSTIDSNGKRNMIMNIILQVLIEYANLEAETMKERSKSGILNAVKKGKAGGSLNFPYGYTKDDDGYLVVDPTEAPIIKEIFDLYKNGNGIKVISNIMNEKGYPTRSNKSFGDKIIKYKTPKEAAKIKWSDKQIHDILRNTIYKGERRFKGEVIPIEPIVSQELFDECQSIMQGKTHRNYLTTYTYLLKDLCTCGKCGRNYFAKYKPVPHGDKVYICSSRLIKSGNCGNCGVNISLLESTLYDVLLNSELVLKYLNNKSGMKQELINSLEVLKIQHPQLEKEFKSKGREQERLLDLYLSDGITKKQFTERKGKIESEIEAISEKLNLVKSEISNKSQALKKLESNKTSKDMLINAKNDRSQLRVLFQQIFHGAVINQLDKNNVLVTLSLTVNGVVLNNTIKILLDIGGIRQRPMIYRYKSLAVMEFEPQFKNGVLKTSADDILDEFSSPVYEWIKIPESNWLFVE